MAYGIPVISTKSEGPSEIVKNFNGLLVDHNNVVKYKKAMQKFFLKKFKYNKGQLRKDIINRFGPKKFVFDAKKIYKKILNKKNV